MALTFGGGQAACHHENKTTMNNDDPTKSVSHDDKLLGAQLELPCTQSSPHFMKSFTVVGITRRSRTSSIENGRGAVSSLA